MFSVSMDSLGFVALDLFEHKNDYSFVSMVKTFQSNVMSADIDLYVNHFEKFRSKRQVKRSKNERQF